MHVFLDNVHPDCYCSEIAGSIEEDTLLAIWNGVKMQKYRENMINGAMDYCNKGCVMGVIERMRPVQKRNI